MARHLREGAEPTAAKGATGPPLEVLSPRVLWTSLLKSIQLASRKLAHVFIWVPDSPLRPNEDLLRWRFVNGISLALNTGFELEQEVVILDKVGRVHLRLCRKSVEGAKRAFVRGITHFLFAPARVCSVDTVAYPHAKKTCLE